MCRSADQTYPSVLRKLSIILHEDLFIYFVVYKTTKYRAYAGDSLDIDSSKYCTCYVRNCFPVDSRQLNFILQ